MRSQCLQRRAVHDYIAERRKGAEKNKGAWCAGADGVRMSGDRLEYLLGRRDNFERAHSKAKNAPLPPVLAEINTRIVDEIEQIIGT